ncbi:uncharacterized protein FPOAC1_013424 [Fusarium poae]|uniref:uncharacterized protein n=1 Tax=Fusarium poae TaxID=36050 RepID=UPI001D046016|nr:uncharacterized protein FPOAC1_013424 [Fusarium poae]KAG8664644.1 hypothetical protein FPOAC1_013424 [Fusarium poae]
MSSASPAPLSSEPSDELLGPASPGSPVPAKRILDRWRQKVYSTASGVKDEFDCFIYISNLKSSNGLVLTILRRAHRLGLDNKRPYSGGFNRRSERISPLYRMAIDIFCIPSMSTEAERIFSGAKRQVRWDRSRMSAKMVEACECIKSWISVPKGKSRPLLAGVFREAEDIDAAVRILDTPRRYRDE